MTDAAASELCTLETTVSRWDRSTDIGELIGAMSLAQGMFDAVSKDREVEGKIRYAYATLASVQGATRKALAANGLALIQSPRIDVEAGICSVDAFLGHKSGQWMSCQIAAPIPDDGRLSAVQSMGSIITYLKRYQWSAICGVSSEEEDDDAAPEPQRSQPRRDQRDIGHNAAAREQAHSGPVTDVPFMSAEERAAAEALPKSDPWAEVVKGAVASVDAMSTVAELSKGMLDFETVGVSDDALNAVRRAAMRRMIVVAASPAELAVAATLGKSTTASPEWHKESKGLYGARAADLKKAS